MGDSDGMIGFVGGASSIVVVDRILVLGRGRRGISRSGSIISVISAVGAWCEPQRSGYQCGSGSSGSYQ